ncbi:MAG: PepSY domain-containing protein [Xanthobacteraceae bacterium]
MEINMPRRSIMIVTMLSSLICFTGFALGADDQHALIKSLGSAKISLQRGLTAAQRQGQPISGKFEVEDGKFQLSVYTANKGQFAEVLVDYSTGKIVKSEPITQGGDLDAAKAQSEALAKAKIPLRAAVDKAAKQSQGFRAISVTPTLKDGRAIALVVLLKGEELKGIEQSLE